MNIPGLVLVASLCSLSPIDPPPKKDLVDTAVAAGSFGTLVKAVQAAGLEQALRGEGPFTVFAPSDDAFAKLPKGTLQELLRPENRATLTKILKHHVVAGSVGSTAALQAGSAKTLAGTTVAIALSSGRLTVAGAGVVQNDIETKNGVIHVIDTVLIPQAAVAPIETSTRAVLEVAIDRGVPLYNRGQEDACVAIYEIAALSALRTASLDAEQREALADAIRKARIEEPKRAAWTLRRAIDAVLSTIGREPTPTARNTSRTLKPRSETKNMSIQEFADGDEARQWRVVNDTVMGGRSSSRMEPGEGETAAFTGDLSLENNGGFASVRRAIRRGSLEGKQGIEMRVRGDGRTYRFTASRSSLMSGQLYDIEFPTEKGEWTVVRLPFARMERNIRGYRPKSGPPSPEKIDSIGFLLGDKKAGSFRLEIDWIRAW